MQTLVVAARTKTRRRHVAGLSRLEPNKGHCDSGHFLFIVNLTPSKAGIHANIVTLPYPRCITWSPTYAFIELFRIGSLYAHLDNRCVE